MFAVWEYKEDIRQLISFLKVTQKWPIIVKCFAES